MASDKLRFAIFGNTFQGKKSASIQKVIDRLERHNAQIYIDRPFYDFLRHHGQMLSDSPEVFDGDNYDADFVISMGGDGTFLKTAVRVGMKNIPIIGVNTGRLGFLADVMPDEFGTALDAIYRGRYTTESHTALMAETDVKQLKNEPFALNDIAVLKRDNASMISIHTCIDGEYLVTYQADGLIVSTPTGSTAYSLSNGGPIIVPRTNTMCLTPVAPHSLNMRPIVISGDSTVTLSVESRSHNFLMAVDGRSETLTEGTSITISKAPFITNILKRPGHNYFASLREKMMWGADKRED